MSAGRVLVVEDDPIIADLIRSNLEVRGYEVQVSSDGLGVTDLARAMQPDIVVLDLMLPEADGFEICRELRTLSPVGLIVVSARGAETDKVRALNLGADDYLTKPFGIQELLARMSATLRRSKRTDVGESSDVLEFETLRIDAAARSVHVRGERVPLTATEFTLLLTLARNHGQAMRYADLLEQVWGTGYQHSRDYVRVYVGRLRSKLEHPDEPPLILNEPRVGYRFVASRTGGEPTAG